jgi:peptide chain release factor 1
MFSKLGEVEERFIDLEREMMQPEIAADPKRYRSTAKQAAELRPLVTTYREYKQIEAELLEYQELIQGDDEELKFLAQEELPDLQVKKEVLVDKLRHLLLPKDPNDEKNVVLEIRAGTGGDEAALFAADLFRMYSRYADQCRWKVEILSQNMIGVGGFKEIIALVQGQGVYSQLKFESGVHRVQRVPSTESQGRIHTSAVTVAILPEVDDVELEIKPNDLRIDVYRASGPGGQSVNTTDSAVRITHVPTGLVVSCQDEKSQHKNKAKGMQILKARLFDLKQQEQHDQISADRRQQVGSGDRSERIRTYNFPQGRITDHRIGLTLHKLEQVMAGDLDEIISALITFYQAEALKAGQG